MEPALTHVLDHLATPTHDRGRESVTARTSPSLIRFLIVGAAASIAAGIVHAGAIAGHSEHRAAVWAFLNISVVQVAWGAYALARPKRWVAAWGAVISAAALVGWIVAKTKGLTFIDGLDDKEPVQLADGLAAALASITLVACAAALIVKRRVPSHAVVSVLALALLVTSGPGTAAALDHEHVHGTAELASAVPPRPFDPALPIDLGGVPGVTPQQQARAENLLAETVMRLPQWSEPAFVEAQGFVSIGDGVTGTEHYLNPTFMTDDVILDPDKPESLVFDTTATPKKLVAAMFMMTPGTTLADVPDVGGALTQWHIHDNLCFNAQGRISSLTRADGTCPRSLVKGPETPMIHVWIVPHTCGPFAALEGIGGGQVAPGQTVACDHVHGS
jgi:hypothetical protein